MGLKANISKPVKRHKIVKTPAAGLMSFSTESVTNILCFGRCSQSTDR